MLANSFFNAIILICRSTNLQKKTRQPRNKTISQNVKDIQKEFPKRINHADHGKDHAQYIRIQ